LESWPQERVSLSVAGIALQSIGAKNMPLQSRLRRQ
jgi:hypothetical protein